MLDKKFIVIGYSGHGLAVSDIALENGLNLIGYSEKKIIENNPFKLDYLGSETNIDFLGWRNEYGLLIGVGNNIVRDKIYNLILQKGKIVPLLVSISAHVSKNVQIGNGTFINKNVTVNISSKIGENVILNSACIIEHECVISNSVHIAPGAVLAGNIFIGERTFIGANSVIKQGVKIGSDVIVGAGSVVLKDIKDGKKVVGNPCRSI